MQVPLTLLARVAKPTRMPTFKGKEEYQHYKQMLDSLPEQSIQRIALIKRVEVTEVPPVMPIDRRPHANLAKNLSKTLENTDKALKQIIDEYMRLHQDKNHPFPSRARKADEHLENLRQAIFDTLKEHGYDWFGNKKGGPREIVQDIPTAATRPGRVAEVLTDLKDKLKSKVQRQP